MKRNKIFGLVAVVLGGAVLSSTGWASDRGRTPTATSIVVNAGTGVGATQVVSTQIRFPGGRDRNRSSVVSSGTNSNFNGAFRGRGRNNNNGNVTVIYPDNGNGNDYNNSNYLGLPPWYRMNYYTPWMSDYENGTAGQNIPSSHANRGYGIPDDAVGENMGYSPNNASAPGTSASVDYVVAVQRELRRRGFYNGVVNGVSDAATRASIRSFETNMGMPVTGVIGFPLLRTLGFF